MARRKTLTYSEMCLYCAKFDMATQNCNAKKEKVNPQSKPEDLQCKRYKMSDDAKFCFSEDGISYYEKNQWSDFKRKALMTKYENNLKVRM